MNFRPHREYLLLVRQCSVTPPERKTLSTMDDQMPIIQADFRIQGLLGLAADSKNGNPCQQPITIKTIPFCEDLKITVGIVGAVPISLKSENYLRIPDIFDAFKRCRNHANKTNNQLLANCPHIIIINDFQIPSPRTRTILTIPGAGNP